MTRWMCTGCEVHSFVKSGIGIPQAPCPLCGYDNDWAEVPRSRANPDELVAAINPDRVFCCPEPESLEAAQLDAIWGGVACAFRVLADDDTGLCMSSGKWYNVYAEWRAGAMIELSIKDGAEP